MFRQQPGSGFLHLFLSLFLVIQLYLLVFYSLPFLPPLPRIRLLQHSLAFNWETYMAGSVLSASLGVFGARPITTVLIYALDL